MKKSVVLLCVIGMFAACGNEVETPQQGLQAIADLYAAGDFDTLIRTRYAEIDKAKDEAQIQQLIERFTTRFADETQRARAVASYEEAAAMQPTLSENGTVATFQIEEGTVKISMKKDGKWGFHL